MTSVDKHHLTSFHPLNKVSDRYLDNLHEKSLVVEIPKGQYLFRNIRSKHPRVHTLYYFLLEGEVELRHTMFSKTRVRSNTAESHFSIDESGDDNTSALAVTDCKILHLNRDLVDQVILHSQEISYTVVDITSANDNDHSDDWMGTFLKSHLMSNLSPKNIHRFFAAAEDIPVKRGQTIVCEGTPGTHFYVIKQGNAKSHTHQSAYARLQTCELSPGDCFGEDALIADTVHVETVTMSSEGVLARLDRQMFINLFSQALIQSVDDERMASFTPEDLSQCELVDVRLHVEYRSGHRQNSRNIPIGALRHKMNEFDQRKVYLVTDEGGARSDWAAYWLRKSGFNAYLLKKTS